MSTSAVNLPSLFWRRRQAGLTSNDATEPVELAHTPTWPAHLPPPVNAISGYPQPNLYLQLSQILEWEIWTHNQTRVELASEKGRYAELEARMYKISDELAHWQKTCQDVYAALDEHRVEHGKLRQEMDTAAAGHPGHELHERKVRTDPTSYVTMNADSAEKTPEPWNPQSTACPVKSEVMLVPAHARPGSQTPRAGEGGRMVLWENMEMHRHESV